MAKVPIDVTIIVKSSDIVPAMAAVRQMVRKAWINGYIRGAERKQEPYAVSEREAEIAYAREFPDG